MFMAPSCLNGTRPLAQIRRSGSGSSFEGVVTEDPGNGMDEIDEWLDDLSEASPGKAWNAADELATITSELEALDGSLIAREEAGGGDFNETFPPSHLAIMDADMDEFDDAGQSQNHFFETPVLRDVATSLPLPSKAPGPICADDARRMAIPSLHPSIGHYARQLPKVKGGGKGGGKGKGNGQEHKSWKGCMCCNCKKG